MRLFLSDAHLVGKLLDLFTPEEMAAEGFTAAEIARAEWVNEDFDQYLTSHLGKDWDMQEAS